MVPLMKLLVSCDTDTSANGIRWPKHHIASHFNCIDLRNVMLPFLYNWHHLLQRPVSMASHKLECHVASFFNYLDLIDTVMPFTIPLASCDANTGAWCITWPKNQCCTSFWLPWLNKCSGAFDDAIGIPWWQCWCQWHYMTKRSCCINSWSSLPQKSKGDTDDNVGIVWH